jgi:hypothetical protein
MPIEQVIWKVGDSPQRLTESTLDSEHILEELICKDINILNDQWLLIGRQVLTAYNNTLDLLAIDASGSLIIIELKKNKTPREVVAQAIDYASWVKSIDASKVADIFEKFSHDYLLSKKSLDQAFVERFGFPLAEDDVNSSHQIVIVAPELDSSSERIVKYLSDSSIPINAIFFRVFRDGDNLYMSRAWFIDPAETQVQTMAARSAEPWNGEYYVSFGHNMGRDWEDARKYGFISAGGGRWYSKTLNQLEKGDRVWVNIPRSGYVGVGIVESPVVKIDEFKVQTEEGELPLLEAQVNADYHKQWVDDEDKAEYVVRVNWLRTVPIKKAVSELGFFGNQNTVCKPTTPKWNHTVERLKTTFQIDM